jgi:hypothetical protein
MQTTSRVPGERKSPDSPFGQFAADLIRRKARELCRLSAFQNCDRTDIEQELRLLLVKRLPKFDASIAHFNAFVTTVVERFCASLIEHQTAKSRSPKRNGGSLNQTCTGTEGKVSQAANQIEESHTSNRTGVRVRGKAQRGRETLLRASTTPRLQRPQSSRIHRGARSIHLPKISRQSPRSKPSFPTEQKLRHRRLR